MNINKRIGILLVKIRTDHNYSQGYIAGKIGKKRQTVYKYEKGMISISVDDLEEILSIYGKSLIEFLSEANRL